MITSMTGFGRGAAEREGARVRVELRSVNSRFCEIQVRCGHGLQPFEPAIRERLQERVQRGKIAAQVDWEAGSRVAGLPVLDEAVARRYVRELARLGALAGIETRPDWAALVRLPGLFNTESDSGIDPEILQGLVLAAVDQALEEFLCMRAGEGESLNRDLRERLAAIEQRLQQIEVLARDGRAQVQERLRDKIRALLQPGEVAEERLAMEVVLIAERSDIAEEIVRFHSHNVQFVETLIRGGEVGRRLNFLLQEMNREINTINSKTNDSAISYLGLEVKEEVERLREQVQNLV